MHLVGQRALGIAILAVLALLVIVKRAATGSIMRDTPSGGALSPAGFAFMRIPFEEAGPRQSYGDRYVASRQEVRRLIPFLP